MSTAGKTKQLLADFLGEKAVLVVEPSANFRASIKQFLANLRVRKVKLVTSVADARREMLTTKVGLFIVEWALDGTNGLQLCRSLRKEAAYRDTPFLLLSTENLRKDVILASEVRIDAYLIKPFSYEDFSAQIGAILAEQANPSRLRLLLESAEDKLARGDLEQAEQLYLEAQGVSDKSARALCGLARVKRQRGDPKAAVALLNQAVALNAEYIEAYRVMLDIHEEQFNRAGIIHTASILHSLSPENPRYTLMLARCYLEMSALEASEKFFRKTVSLSPRLAEAYKGLGNVYLAQEEYEKAMRSFKKALDLDENDVSTLNSLGTTYVRMEQYKEGIDKYMLALKLDPHDARVLFNIGHAHEKRGDLDKAKWYYAQALINKAGFDKAVRGLERLEKLRSEAVSDDDAGPSLPAGEILKKSS